MNNQNQQPVVSQEQQPIQSQPKKSKPRWLIPLIVIAGIIAIGLIAWGSYFLFKPVLPKLPEAGEIREDEFKDWKTYRNEAYGYEIKFPKEWFWKYFGEIDERNLDALELGSKTVAKLGDGDISVSVELLLLKESFSPKDIETEFELPNFQSKVTTINNKKAIEYTAKVGDKNIKGVAILFNTEDKRVYKIVVRTEENFSLFDQILSTFKFTR